MKTFKFVVLTFSFFMAFAYLKLCQANDSANIGMDKSRNVFAENAQSVYQISAQLIQAGKLTQAEELLDKAIAKNQNDPHLLRLMGQTYIEMKKFDQAQTYLEKAFKINPQLDDLAYDLGLVYFKQSKFEESSEILLPFLQSKPNHVLASYYAGMSLYKVKKYKKAIPYLVKASEKNDDIRATGYYHAAIAMFLSGQVSDALETFKYVRKLPDAGMLYDYAEKWIKEIEKNKKGLKPYNIFFKIGILYDDNVRLETNEDDYADEDDTACETFFDLSYKLTESDLIMGAGINHYQKWHTDLSGYDLSGTSMAFSVKSRQDKVTYGINYRPTYYTNSNDRYSLQNRITPEISFQMSDRLFTIFSFGYMMNNNYQKDIYDSQSVELATDIFYKQDNNQGLIMIGLVAESNSANDIYESYEQIKVNLGYQRKIPFGIDAGGSVKFNRKMFSRKKPNETAVRADNKYSLSLDLSRRLNTWLKGSIELKLVKRDSNIKSYDYDKKAAGFYLTVDY